MARIIMKSPYLKPNSGGGKHRGNYAKYIATREGVEMAEDTTKHLHATVKQEDLIRQLLRDFPDSTDFHEYGDYKQSPTRENATELISRVLETHGGELANRERYVSYIAERSGVEKLGKHGLFTDEGVPIVLEQVSREMAESQSNIWTHIISLNREDAARLGYDSAEDWMNLLRSKRNVIAQQMRIKPENFRWYAAFHDAGHHPHVHMMAYSIDPKEAYLTEKGIETIKRMVVGLLQTSSPLRQQEEAVRRVYHSYMKDVNKRRAANQRYYGGVDYDSGRMKRRIAATAATMEEFKSRFHKACPVVPDGFDFETDWAEANATPRLAYDMEEEFKAGLLGAAIWILDVIRDRGDIRAVAELLPDHVDPTEVGMPDVWDPCHSEEMLLGMLSILQNRNADCTGIKNPEKKTGSPKNRYYFDSYTVENLHKQDVPSRIVFEKILSYIPDADIDRAVAAYMDKYWDVVERYYKSRCVYAQEEAYLCSAIARYNSRVDSATMELARTTQSRSPLAALNKPMLLAMMQGLPVALPQGQPSASLTVASQYQNLIQTAQRLQSEKEELDERWDEVGDRVSELWCDTSCFLLKPREWIAEQYGEEIADIWDGFEIEDPYELCFAFLYLVDQGSDYPWLYYPGVTLFSMTMDTLPWCRTAYKGDPEGVWDHFDTDTMELIPGPEKAELPKRIKVPELEKWNRMQYLDQYEDELGYQEKVSLAQVLYEITGCIMPRNQHYEPMIEEQCGGNEAVRQQIIMGLKDAILHYDLNDQEKNERYLREKSPDAE